MRILVTGGAGFIGSHTIDALRAAGHAVRVFDNLSSGRGENLAQHPDIDIREGDLRDLDAVCRALAGCDAVMHLAALVSVPLSLSMPLETVAINATGTAHVLEAARLAPLPDGSLARVVLASTSAVYGDLPGRKDESSPLAPLVPYATSKLMAEALLAVYQRSYGLPVVRLRYFNVYGTRQRADSPYSGVLAKWTAAARAGAECLVFGDGEQTRDFVHVRDVARANVAALTAPLPEANPLFVVATGASVTLNGVLAVLQTAARKPLRITHRPAREGDIAHSSADSSRLRSLFGWSPQVALEEGLGELLRER
jgi:UDP-glucose 4-epimerase